MADRQGSEGALTYDPGADAAARYPDWVIRHRTIGWGISEVMCRKSKVILLEKADTLAEKRCSLAHAVAHLDLCHDVMPSDFFDVRQEAHANQLAARRLIDLNDLASALRWTREPTEVAAELAVDLATLRCRNRHLHPAERAELKRKIQRLEEVA